MSAQFQAAASALVQQILGICRAMGMYDPGNHAVSAALQNFASAINTFVPPGGQATIQFVDNMLVVNEVRVHPTAALAPLFEGLHGMFKQRGIGGLAFTRPMDTETLRAWFPVFGQGVAGDNVSRERARGALEGQVHLGIEPMGTKTLGDADAKKINVSTMSFAMQTYARTVLSVREFADAVRRRRNPFSSPLNVVRVVQDLIEVVNDSSTNLLRILQLQSSRPADASESFARIHAANTAVYSLLLGRLFGVRRIEMLDLGLAGLMVNMGYEFFPELAEQVDLSPTPSSLRSLSLKLAPILASGSAVGLDAVKRLTVAHEHRLSYSDGSAATELHPYSRLVAVAEEFDRRTRPASGKQAQAPLDALKDLHLLAGSRFDPLVVGALKALLDSYYSSQQPAS